jgi:hypothetical protein
VIPVNHEPVCSRVPRVGRRHAGPREHLSPAAARRRCAGSGSAWSATGRTLVPDLDRRARQRSAPPPQGRSSLPPGTNRSTTDPAQVIYRSSAPILLPARLDSAPPARGEQLLFTSALVVHPITWSSRWFTCQDMSCPVRGGTGRPIFEMVAIEPNLVFAGHLKPASAPGTVARLVGGSGSKALKAARRCHCWRWSASCCCSPRTRPPLKPWARIRPSFRVGAASGQRLCRGAAPSGRRSSRSGAC